MWPFSPKDSLIFRVRSTGPSSFAIGCYSYLSQTHYCIVLQISYAIFILSTCSKYSIKTSLKILLDITQRRQTSFTQTTRCKSSIVRDMTETVSTVLSSEAAAAGESCLVNLQDSSTSSSPVKALFAHETVKGQLHRHHHQLRQTLGEQGVSRTVKILPKCQQGRRPRGKSCMSWYR